LNKAKNSTCLTYIIHFPGKPVPKCLPLSILFDLWMREVVTTTGVVRCANLQSNHHQQQTNTQRFTGRTMFSLSCAQAAWLCAASFVILYAKPTCYCMFLCQYDATSNLQLICCTEVQQSLTNTPSGVLCLRGPRLMSNTIELGMELSSY